MMSTNEVGRTFDPYSTTYKDAVNSSISFSGLKVDFFTKVKADHIRSLVTGHHGEGAPLSLSLLDVGCGIGNYHSLLADGRYAISGVDVSESCIATARERNPGVDYRTYDGEALPYPTGTFDVAYAVCVLHHVPPARWPAFAGELRRVVKPGGLALIFEHNPFNPLTRRAVSNCPFDADAVLLTARRTAGLLAQAGFDSVKHKYILTVPPTNGWLARLDAWLSRLPFGAQYYVAAS